MREEGGGKFWDPLNFWENEKIGREERYSFDLICLVLLFIVARNMFDYRGISGELIILIFFFSKSH